MRTRACRRHGPERPCTCAMGHLSRFVEPVVLMLLKRKGQSYGYDLASGLTESAFTDAPVDKAALYRTLRQLEANGHVVSKWEMDQSGPARRVYQLTDLGERHLDEWIAVLEHLSQSMARFVEEAKALRGA